MYALSGSGNDALRKRAHRLGACCCCPTFRDNGDGKMGVSLARCRDRLCPLCARRRGWTATAKVAAIVRTFNAPRLVTLTLKSNADHLSACVTRLFKSFAELREFEEWDSRVKGGVWALEITRNTTTGLWHAHLHIITDGQYLPQPMLKKLWREITGDSYIVDVRAVHDRAEAARYVAGYIAKPAHAADWPMQSIAEYAVALHGKRLMQPFGSARKAIIDEDDGDEDPPHSTPLCTAHALNVACVTGYEPALRAKDIVCRMGPDFAIAAGVEPYNGTGCNVPVEPAELAFAFETLRRIQNCWPNLPDDAPPDPHPPPSYASHQMTLGLQTRPSV